MMSEKFQPQPPPYSPHNPGAYPNLNQPSVPGQYPAGYMPATQGQPQPTIIINKTKFGPFPVRTTCQICRNEVVTQTYSSAGLLSWLLGGACCLIGCVFGCCLIPFCVDSCRDVIHKCPSCNAEIALYKRL